jgi:cell division septum initiation protein DivIVA
MSDELIRSLNKRIEDLTTENAAIKQEVITRRKAAQGVKKDAESLKEQVDALTAEWDKWRTQAEATPAETAKRIKELEGQVKRAGVKERFQEIASGLAEKVNLDVLFNNVGFDPTSEGSEQANTS